MEDEDGSWWCQHVETYFGTDDEDPGSALGEVERVPLFAAAARGNLRALQLLVDAGADVNFWHAEMNAALVAVRAALAGGARGGHGSRPSRAGGAAPPVWLRVVWRLQR